jgi:hypothetical protein
MGKRRQSIHEMNRELEEHDEIYTLVLQLTDSIFAYSIKQKSSVPPKLLHWAYSASSPLSTFLHKRRTVSWGPFLIRRDISDTVYK